MLDEYGPLEPGKADDLDILNPSQLLTSPSSNFTALGLQFSQKEGVGEFVKNYDE